MEAYYEEVCQILMLLNVEVMSAADGRGGGGRLRACLNPPPFPQENKMSLLRPLVGHKLFVQSHKDISALMHVKTGGPSSLRLTAQMGWLKPRLRKTEISC